MKIQAGIDRIAVKLNKFHIDSITHGTLSLVINKEYNKEWNIITKAEIIAPPFRCSPKYKSFIDQLDDFEFLYFDYKSLEEDEFVTDESGNKIYFVEMELVFAATLEIAGNKILPNNGIILCSPFYGFGFEEIQVGDRKMWVSQSPSGIFTGISESPDDRIAYAEHVGDRFPDDPEEIIVEKDLLFREMHTNYEYEIAGTKFWVVRRENVDMVLAPTNFSWTGSDRVENEYKSAIDATGNRRLAIEGNAEAAKHKKIY